jgi:uncharacterized membrane protein YfcA
LALAAILLLALVSGVLIGCIGIGGVLLVPVLSLLDVPVHRAVAAGMVGFIASGAIATWHYARRGSIDWPSAAWLCFGAAPAAFLGAALGNRANGAVLTALIGITVIFAGARSLGRDRRGESLGQPKLTPPVLALIGAAVGVASAVTGTGGPVLLVPVLLWLELPILTAIGLSQAIQLPIALTATLGNIVYGVLDWELAGLLSPGVVVGSWAGARLAHVVPVPALARLVGIVLLLVGAILIVRASA